MKSILVKRLESSFEAFKKTLSRFIISYEKFLNMCIDGEIYISKKVDVYDLLDNGDDEKLMDLVEGGTVQYYPISNFNEEFIPSIECDLNILRELKNKWDQVIEDPKKDQFLIELKENKKLKNQKIIIFTESRETAEYVGKYLELEYPEQVITFSGQGSRSIRQEIEANYNPDYVYDKKHNIKYLVTTDVLAEGINLHRSNVIINYDLPWNPTKVMQRVGRINRVGTEHNTIHVFNFFPTAQATKHLTLEENIKLKIQAFHDTLGEDFKYLSEDEEISSHNLYEKLNSKETFDGESNNETSELKYLKIIRDTRDKDEELYHKIKKLPQKSKSSKKYKGFKDDKTISFLRKGSLKKFFIADSDDANEISFLRAMTYLETSVNESRVQISEEYFEHLKLNKLAFDIALSDEENIIVEKTTRTGNEPKIIKLLKAIIKCRTFTDDQEELIKKMREVWEDGSIPATISKEVVKQTKGISDPIKVFYIIKEIVPEKYFQERKIIKKANTSDDIKIILSSFLNKGE